ncbi:MAG TPA: hypothetical protein VF796_06920, partial [Humisphaera sp.]
MEHEAKPDLRAKADDDAEPGPTPKRSKAWLAFPITVVPGLVLGLAVGVIVALALGWAADDAEVTATIAYGTLAGAAAGGAVVGLLVAAILKTLARRRDARLAAAAAVQRGVVHDLIAFPPALLAAATFVTGGAFGLVWLAAVHGRVPKTRGDDPGAGKAVGLLLVPVYSLYWFFALGRRLCDRLDDVMAKAGMDRRSPRRRLKAAGVCRASVVLAPLNLLLLPSTV